MPIPAGFDSTTTSLSYPFPLTEDFTYKLGENGVILNPNSTAFPFIDIESVKGLDNAPYRTTERDHEGTEGGFMDAEYEKGRSVVLEGNIYADGESAESVLDQLKANFAPSRNLIKFYFKHPGVPERFVKVKPLGVRFDVNQIRRLGYTAVQFHMFAEDPRIYSADIRHYSIPQAPLIVSGRSYPRSYNYGYGDPIAPSQTNLYVEGNRLTPPLFTISGTATLPRIVNDTLGVEMIFDLTVPAGSLLEVDTYYHTVRLDGANRRSSLISPTWFHLAPGDNYIRYRSNSAGGSVLNVQYYDAWR